MRISVVTVLSDVYEPFIKTSLLGRAISAGIVGVDVDRFSAFVRPKERIDSPIFGPGSGMLIRPVVVERAVEAKEAAHGPAFKVFFAPHGVKFDQCLARTLAAKLQECKHLMFIVGRYEGIDSRVEDVYADMVVSLGDFVTMGGDVAALAVLESVARLIPGVVGKSESVVEESFSGPFVEYPHYTEPLLWKGRDVPEIVRSGNHGAIAAWRADKAAERTVKGHVSWLRSCHLEAEDRALVRKHLPHHYVALLHKDVLVGNSKAPGTTSVTSMDIHDIARSCKTYGVERFFIVTPLVDQQKIVRTLLDFWMTEGIEYNVERHEAIKNVSLECDLARVLDVIEVREGKKPVIIATSARAVGHDELLCFSDQARVWALDRPVLFIFGTGRGMTEERIRSADFLLRPITSFSEYNHLSVRSAVAVILDRWLGVSEKSCALLL